MSQWMRRVVQWTGLTFVAAGGVLNGIGCSGDDVTTPTTGSLEITTATSGPDPDPDGYAVAIDGGASAPLGLNATLHAADIEPGGHSVQLSGIAANCTLTGDNPRTVTVAPGGSATVTFAITCATPQPLTGILRITTSTTGPDQDDDGYEFAVDGGATQPIGVTATATVPNVALGAHSVQLSGMAENCSVQGANPQSVSVSSGNTAEVTFAVVCSAIQQGSRIAFTRTRDGNSEIYVMNGDGTGVIRLTNNPDQESDPAWSPDGSRIVFGRFPDIYVMNVDGTGEVKLTGDEARNYSASWSPGGTQIAFVRDTSSASWPYSKITIMNDDGTGQVGLGDAAWAYSSAEWSRDGSRIVYGAAYEDTPPIIGVMNSDGSGESTILQDYNLCPFDPAWSTDGRIAFSSNSYVITDEGGDYCEGGHQIYVMNSDGSGMVQLTNNSGIHPAWSRDDRKIAFVRSDGIYVMNADGTGETRLGPGSAPTWSP
jgi:Tol biopolymer transport system component